MMTPGGWGGRVKMPGVGLGPVGGSKGQLGIWQQVGSCGSGSSLQPGCTLSYTAHLNSRKNKF